MTNDITSAINEGARHRTATGTLSQRCLLFPRMACLILPGSQLVSHAGWRRGLGDGNSEAEEKEEEENGSFKANAVNEEDPKRVRATPA